MKCMISILTSFFMILLIQPLCAGTANAETSDSAKLTARQIMAKVDSRDDGDYWEQEMEMILIDKNGNKRIRNIKSYGRDAGKKKEDNESIMFFLSPADVKNTGFLTYDYSDDEKDDDQWLYLPALRKSKRIASSNKASSFMGSDFTYADMTKRDIDYYDYKILKEDEVNGHPVWVIQSIANNEKEIRETGYTKSVMFVRKDNFVVVRSVNWVKKGKYLKYMDVKKLEKIDGIWVATETIMSTKKGKRTRHKTVMRTKNIKFNQRLPDDLFSVRYLEKGL